MNKINNIFFGARVSSSASQRSPLQKQSLRSEIQQQMDAYEARGGAVTYGEPPKYQLLLESPRRAHPAPYERKTSRYDGARTRDGKRVTSGYVSLSEAMTRLGLDAESTPARERFYREHQSHIERVVKSDGKTYRYFTERYVSDLARRLAKGGAA